MQNHYWGLLTLLLLTTLELQVCDAALREDNRPYDRNVMVLYCNPRASLLARILHPRAHSSKICAKLACQCGMTVARQCGLWPPPPPSKNRTSFPIESWHDSCIHPPRFLQFRVILCKIQVLSNSSTLHLTRSPAPSILLSTNCQLVTMCPRR